MAEGIVHNVKSLEELERDITCAICQEHYSEPKVLPCLHYYCKQCILKLALRTATNQPFPCPECRKETTLPEGGVDELKTAFFVHRLKDMYSTVERVCSKVEVKCEGCTDSGDKAEAFCRQCAMFICKECINQHKRMKAFISHEVDFLEDLNQGRAREIAVKEPSTMKCHTHEEPLIIYCFDCNSVICRDCTMTAHRNHKFEFSKVAAPNTKKKLLDELDPLREMSVSLSSAVEEVQTTKQEVEAQRRAVTITIQTSFDELHKILEKRQQEILQEAEGIVREKVNKLEMQEKNLSLANGEVKSIIDYTEQFVSHCSDAEVMSMQDEISSRIKCQVEEHNKHDQNMEPVEEANMRVEVRCAETLQQLCQTQAKILQLLKKVDLATENEVNVTSEAFLTTWNSKKTKRKLDFNAQVKSLYNGSIINCTVNKTGPITYSIRYTPTVRGHHELTVSVNRQQIAGSPFPVFVSIPPTQLGQPVKDFVKIIPRGVTINSLGELIVNNCINISKFDMKGEKKVLASHSNNKCSGRMATDSEDNIYCIAERSADILKCDKDGGNVQVHEVKQVKGPGHWGVTVIRDEVMLLECNNKGTIMVYNRELEYLRCIEHGDMGEFEDISADCHGNLYVIDRSNLYIRVFNNKGALLRSFGCDNKNVKIFRAPKSLCVSDRHVFVADVNYSTSCVFVFTPAGDYVMSFGKFLNPSCICKDKNGFIFVAELGNKRVQCF